MPKRPRTPEFEAKEGVEWDTPHRARVKQLRVDNYGAIQIRELTGVPERTQRNIAKETSDRRTGKQRSGRPPKIDQDTIHKMIKAIEGHYSRHTWKWEELKMEWDLPVY